MKIPLSNPGGNDPAIYAQRKLKAIAARWDARANSWDEALQDPACHLNEDEAYNRFLQTLQRIAARRARFCAKRGIIDAGCGTGLVLEKVSRKFDWAVGVDLSSRMIRAARAKGLSKTKFIVGDCFDLPSLCAEAGAVVSRGVLLSHYGWEQGEALLAAARAALAPNGFILFDFLNAAARKKFEHAPENKTWLASREAQRMARRAGFSKSTILGTQNRRVLLLFARI